MKVAQESFIDLYKKGFLKRKEIEEKLCNNFPFYPSEYDDDQYWELIGFGD